MRTILEEVLMEEYPGKQAHGCNCGCSKCRHQSEQNILDAIWDAEWDDELSSVQVNDAVRYNNSKAQSLGWVNHRHDIVEKVLKLNYTPDDWAFAQAVADWQARNGLSADGMLGNRTWEAMEKVLNIQTQSSSTIPNNSNIDRIPASRLTHSKSDPFPRSFKENVYNKAVNNAKNVRSFSPSLQRSSLESVGNGHSIRKDAAVSLKSLLTRFHSDAATNRVNEKVKISSGYRSADTQFDLWNKRFTDYYIRAINENKLRQNDFGNEAINKLARFISQKTAAPGYSNHQNGLAVDFTVTDLYGRQITSNSTTSASINQWKRTWFWEWLNKNAYFYNFFPYEKEPWHWDFKS